MRLSKTSKALLLILNHLAAAHVPRDMATARLHGPGQGKNSLAARYASMETFDPESHLFGRQACDGCRKRCSPGKIIDPRDCTECKRCPKGQMPDKTQKRCLPNPHDQDRKNQDKERKFQEKIPQKKAEYKAKRYEIKRQDKRRIYHDKRNEEKRRKVRRMGRCLALVPLSMGAQVATEYSDEFFDEQFLEDMELMEFWPEGMQIDAWNDNKSDDIFENDDYVNKWIVVGEAVSKRAVDTNASQAELELIASHPAPHEDTSTKTARIFTSDVVAFPTAATDLTVRGELQARCPICFLIPIFTAAIRTATAVARLVRLTRTAIRIAKGRGSKKTKSEQREGADRIAKDQRWRRCLAKMDP
ncbi:hypothetical protein DL770_010279 [Monosporascus sp. CRB-9-2]|nr:hypothetical protein DL770_010279 [Monosporascus sp. CRB-9-2]